MLWRNLVYAKIDEGQSRKIFEVLHLSLTSDFWQTRNFNFVGLTDPETDPHPARSLLCDPVSGGLTFWHTDWHWHLAWSCRCCCWNNQQCVRLTPWHFLQLPDKHDLTYTITDSSLNQQNLRKCPSAKKCQILLNFWTFFSFGSLFDPVPMVRFGINFFLWKIFA